MVIRRDLLVGALFPLAAILVLSPALSASFYLDDFHLIALARRVDNPFVYFTTSHYFGGHLYRPVPMVLWWLIEHLLGGAKAQYACNALLLGACGASIFWVLRELDWKAAAAAATAALFVLLPGNVGTALWLSDRFDLMAVSSLFAAIAAWLRYLRTGHAQIAWCSFVLFAVAALSKELSYVFPALLSLILILNWRDRREGSFFLDRRPWIAAILACAVFLAALVAWRAHIGVSLIPATGSENLLASFLHSSIKWWRALPAAIVYARAPAADVSPWFAVLLFGGCAALAVVAWRHSGRLAAEGVSRRTGISLGGAILLLVPLIQAPHFSMADVEFAATNGEAVGMFVERYFFFGSAGLLLLLANTFAVLRQAMAGRTRPFISAAGTIVWVLAIAWCLSRGGVVTSRWPLKTEASARIAIAAIAAALRLAPPAGEPCKLVFLNSRDGPFRFASEAMIKVMAADQRIDRCVIETEYPPFISLTDENSLRWYSLPETSVQPPQWVSFGGWVMIPRDQAKTRIDNAHVRVLTLDSSTGIFAER